MQMQQHKPLRIAGGVALLAVTFGACKSASTRTDVEPRTDPHATPAAVTAQQPVADTPDVPLPDLTDPAVRKQFACSFSDGYFNERGDSSDDATSDCQ
jgi:hypothetical protein